MAGQIEHQLPRSADPNSLFTWAQSLINTLRRQGVVISKFETVTQQVTADDAASLVALASYAIDVQEAITAAGGVAQSIYDEYAAAAAAGNAKLAQSYLTQAANTVEQSTRVAADGVLSSSLTTVSASLATTQAGLTTEITARANGDTANASAITTVATQANGNSASISTLQTSVNGISARWGVSINVSGQVIGLVQLDGSASGSVFTVVANKFIVAHPTASGTLITPFVIGLVGGVSTVGISGNLVIDGSIIARHIAAGQVDASKINVSSLSAIAANVGTVTAGVLQSADGNFVIDLNNKTITITT